MPSIHEILFPVDFSQRCRQVAPAVGFWSKHFEARITLVHSYAVPHGEREFATLQEAMRKQLRSASTAALEDFASQELPGLKVQTAIDEGDPGRVVQGLSKGKSGVLVMMPTHGYSGFRRFLIGSVTGKVLHDAECPVWTTPHADSLRGIRPKAPRSILCAVDRDRSSVALIRWAEWLAGQFGAELKLVHALASVDPDSENRGERAVRRHWENRAQQELAPLMVDAGTKAQLILEGGNVSDALCAVATQEKADLMVIGRGQTRKRLGRLRTHSLAIISKSPCPVLSV